MAHWEDLYIGCLGCTGTLKDWLLRALIGALKKNCDTLTWEFLKEYQIPTARLYNSLTIMEESENKLEEKFSQKEIEDLREKLGLKKNPPLEKNQKSDKPKNGRKGRRVGERNPVRDPVGVENLE